MSLNNAARKPVKHVWIIFKTSTLTGKKTPVMAAMTRRAAIRAAAKSNDRRIQWEFLSDGHSIHKFVATK